MGVGKWGGKNECRRGQKEIRRDGATAGKADESRRAIFVEVRVSESGTEAGEGEGNVCRADKKEPRKLELILRPESEEV